MIWGISGRPVPETLLFATPINAIGVEQQFPPCWLYAHAWVETIDEYGPKSAEKMSDNGDGGHGLFQLTSDWPLAWKDPEENARFAVIAFLLPAVEFWNGVLHLEGDALIRCVAAEFNCGRSLAMRGHAENNADKYTTGGDYAARVLTAYSNLDTFGTP